MAERLARDVDDAPEVRDRIAAVRQLLDVVRDLDGAMLGPGETRPTVSGDDEPDQEDPLRALGGDDDDIFNIGDVPPGVEHPPSS